MYPASAIEAGSIRPVPERVAAPAPDQLTGSTTQFSFALVYLGRFR